MRSTLQAQKVDISMYVYYGRPLALPLRYEARIFLLQFDTFFLSSSCGVNKYSHAIKSTFNHPIVIEEMIDNNNDTPSCTCDA